MRSRSMGLVCDEPARDWKVAATAKDQAVAGFEFLEGIPGSIGGALRMNAGAMGWEIFDLVRSVRIADLSGTINQWAKEDLHYRYRSCSDLKNGVALSVVLEGASGDRNAIAQRMNEGSKKRWSSQPAAMSAGCVFRNPDEIPAGKLVDELGLKGMAIGDARVSTIHGNFIVNEGKATAKDILALIEKVKEEALNRRGVELKVEVKIVGSDE